MATVVETSAGVTLIVKTPETVVVTTAVKISRNGLGEVSDGTRRPRLSLQQVVEKAHPSAGAEDETPPTTSHDGPAVTESLGVVEAWATMKSAQATNRRALMANSNTRSRQAQRCGVRPMKKDR